MGIWAGDDQRQGTASAQGMRGFYVGGELTGWRLAGSVDTQELRACGERNNSSIPFPSRVVLQGHGSLHDLQLSQGTPGHRIQ